MMYEDDIPAYKKKSKKKGLPRADHKHIYETVLLTRHLHYDFGDSKRVQPTKVCTICGRISKVDWDDSFWEAHTDSSIGTWRLWMRDLSEKALKLPKWHVDDWGKFAIRTEE